MTRPDIMDVPKIPDGAVIALIVTALCLGCWYGAHAWQARSPLPVSYARPQPGHVAAPEPPKAMTEPLRPILVQTEKYGRLDPPAKVATLSELVRSPWPCDRIRKAIEQFGRETVRQYAKAKGYTKKQIEEALACAPEKQT